MSVAEVSVVFTRDFGRRSHSNDDVGHDPRGEQAVAAKLTTVDPGITRVTFRLFKSRSLKGVNTPAEHFQPFNNAWKGRP